MVTGKTDKGGDTAPAGGRLAGRTILFLVTEDWYFLSHRLPLARAAMAEGARVAVACRVTGRRGEIEGEGIALYPIPFRRSGRNPLSDLRTLAAIHALYRRLRPDLVHHVAVKPVLYGSLAAWMAGVPAVVNAMAGLGFLFISTGAFARVARPGVTALFRILLNRANSMLILQNPDDQAMFVERIGVRPARTTIVPGSGVDIDRFAPSPPPETGDGKVIATCVSRMLWDKGIGELVEAARLLRTRGAPVRIRLVGPTDENPASIPEEVLQGWQREGIVEVSGPSSDIPGVYRDCHIAVLPSYREGFPKSLLEAAACGRPMVATDVPGCREICIDQVTGLLVPAREAAPLADAIERLAADAAMRDALGQAARLAVEKQFSDRAIAGQTMALYKSLLQ